MPGNDIVDIIDASRTRGRGHWDHSLQLPSNKSQKRLVFKNVKTADKDDIQEDGEEELGKEIKKATLKQSWHAIINIPLYDLTFYIVNKIV